MRYLVKRHQFLPIGSRIAAIHRLGVIKTRITLWDEVSVPVSDVTVGIREDRVVRRVGLQLHGLAVSCIAARLRSQKALLQRRDRRIHQSEGDPVIAIVAYHRAVVVVISVEDAFLHALRGLVPQGDLPAFEAALFGPILVSETATLWDDGLQVFVHRIHVAGGVHPTGAVIEALIDKHLSPGHCAVGVEPFIAGHLQLRPEEKRRVRIDQKQSVMIHRIRRRDGKTVGATRFAVHRPQVCLLLQLRRALFRSDQLGLLLTAIVGFKRLQVDLLDVSADAAFSERKRHPGFEVSDDARLHLWMLRQIKVQAISPRIHQALQPLRTGNVVRLQIVWIDEQPLAEILPDLWLPFGLGQPPERDQVVCLHAVEIILALRIGHPKDGVGIGLTMYVRDAPVVPHDRGCLGLGIPARAIG